MLGLVKRFLVGFLTFRVYEVKGLGLVLGRTSL